MKLNKGAKFFVLSLIILVGVLGFASALVENVQINPEYPNLDSFVYVSADISDVDSADLIYTISGQSGVHTTSFSGPLVGDAVIYNGAPESGAVVSYYIETFDSEGILIDETEEYSFTYDDSDPTITITGAPENMLVTQTGVEAEMEYFDLYNDADEIGYTISSTEDVCSTDSSDYILGDSVVVTEHSFICGYARDMAGNEGFTAEPTEFKVFSNIQDAIDYASDGDTINIESGTYATSGQVLINKDLSIIGVGETKPVIQPDSDLTGNNADGAWFLIETGINFNLENVVLDGDTFWVHQGIRSHGYTNIAGVDFQNIQGSLSRTPYRGIAVLSFGGTVPGGAGADTHSTGGASSMLTVTYSTFSQIGRVGILVKGTESTADINNNVYTGKDDGDFLDYAFEVGAGGSAIINENEINDNRGIASSDGSTSAGILVTDYYGTGTEATITGNIISYSTTGIAVGYDETDESVVAANFNQFIDNEYGIESTNPEVNAENNWWGHITGPYHSSTNTDGEGDDVSSNVDYRPWLISAEGGNDVTNPESHITLSGIQYITSLTFNLPFSASDEFYGLNRIRLYEDGSYVSYQNVVGYPTSHSGIFSRTVSSDGTYEYYTLAVDVADNEEDAPLTSDVTIVVDATVPSLDIIAPEEDDVIDAMSYYLVKADAEDLTSGVESVTLTLRKGTEIILENVPMNNGITYYEYSMNMWNLEAGNYVLEITATDKAGNDVTETRAFSIAKNVAPSRIIGVDTNVPIEGGEVSFRFNVTTRGDGDIKFGMDEIAGWSPSGLNASISEDGINYFDVGDSLFNGAEVLGLTDLDTETPNVQGSFVLSLDIPGNMVPGNYPIHYYIDVE